MFFCQAITLRDQRKSQLYTYFVAPEGNPLDFHNRLTAVV